MSKRKILIQILTISLGFCFLGFWLQINGLYYVAGLFLLSLLNLQLATYLLTIWLEIGKKLGAVNSAILLSAFYFMLLWPLRSIKAIFIPKKSKDKQSNWQNASPISDFTRPF
jgi:hypothetical protein